MANSHKQIIKLSIIIFCLIFLFIPSIYAQYIHVDRVGLNNGLGFSGTIIEDQKPQYITIRTQEFGDVKILYTNIKYVLRKPDPNDTFFKKGGHQYFSAGLGYGAEYAGIGARVQIRVGRKTGFAHFIGLGFIDVKRNDKRIYDGATYLYSISQGTYKSYDLSTGLKFYPFTYFYLGVGIQGVLSRMVSTHGFFFTGIDYPIFKNLLINASIGYHPNEAYKYPIENLMINFGISYKITTNPVNYKKNKD
jgi:hypothetical protein